MAQLARMRGVSVAPFFHTNLGTNSIHCHLVGIAQLLSLSCHKSCSTRQHCLFLSTVRSSFLFVHRQLLRCVLTTMHALILQKYVHSFEEHRTIYGFCNESWFVAGLPMLTNEENNVFDLFFYLTLVQRAWPLIRHLIWCHTLPTLTSHDRTLCTDHDLMITQTRTLWSHTTLTDNGHAQTIKTTV